MKAKFDCVFYYVSDVERSVRFYRDVLGVEVSSRDFVARFHLDGVLFEMSPPQMQRNCRAAAMPGFVSKSQT